MASDTSQGGVLAVPHGGPLVTAALQTISAIGTDREISFTYDVSVGPRIIADGGTDFLALFDDRRGKPVVRAHDLSEAGIQAATRSLRRGGVVIVFADVATDIARAVTVPWRDGARTVMRGAAWLSLAGRADLIAAAPIQTRPGAIDIAWRTISLAPQLRRLRAADYFLTLALWDGFEALFDEGATQLILDYDVFRPAPLRALARTLQTREQLTIALKGLSSLYSGLRQGSPTFRALLTSLEQDTAPIVSARS